MSDVEPVEDEPALPPKPPSMFSLKPLDDLEHKITLWVGVVALVVSVVSWVPDFDESIAIAWAGIGAVMSGALIWSAQRRSRFLSGTAAFLVSFAPWRFVFAGMPFLLLGMWLWFRGRPSQEEIAERRRLRDEALAARRAAKRGEAPVPTTGKAPPKPSKRYTPPARKR